MSKTYQRNATTANGVAVPETVTVAMAEIAEDMGEVCWPWRSVPACR